MRVSRRPCSLRFLPAVLLRRGVRSAPPRPHLDATVPAPGALRPHSWGPGPAPETSSARRAASLPYCSRHAAGCREPRHEPPSLPKLRQMLRGQGWGWGAWTTRELSLSSLPLWDGEMDRAGSVGLPPGKPHQRR